MSLTLRQIDPLVARDFVANAARDSGLVGHLILSLDKLSYGTPYAVIPATVSTTDILRNGLDASLQPLIESEEEESDAFVSNLITSMYGQSHSVLLHVPVARRDDHYLEASPLSKYTCFYRDEVYLLLGDDDAVTRILDAIRFSCRHVLIGIVMPFQFRTDRNRDLSEDTMAAAVRTATLMFCLGFDGDSFIVWQW